MVGKVKRIVSIHVTASGARCKIGQYGVCDSFSEEFVNALESRLRHDYHDKVILVVERLYL